MIPYARQSISEEDIAAVQTVLRSDWLTQGPMIERFETAILQYCGAHFSVAMSNATSALHLACLALGLKQGDNVWTSPNSFVATANCTLYCGAKIDFVDIDSDTYNMCPKALERKLAIAKKNNQLPKIVIPVHFAGQPCEMKLIYELAKEFGFAIIEDASHAIGATYLDTKIGDCKYSDITVFSFHPVKLITTGEGGMALTNNPALYHQLDLLRSHGITRDPSKMISASEGKWYYQQIALGYNYRMTDIQAALGVSQILQLNKFITRRRAIAARYHTELAHLPLILPKQHPSAQSAWHLYAIQVRKDRERLPLFNQLRTAGINVNVHYIPIHIQPFYQNLGFKVGDYPNAEEYYQRAISLPIYYGLSEDNQSYVIQILKRLVG